MIKTKILNSRFTINVGRGKNELRVLSERRWSSATGLELKDPQRWAERVAVVKAVHPDACPKKPCWAVFSQAASQGVMCSQLPVPRQRFQKCLRKRWGERCYCWWTLQILHSLKWPYFFLKKEVCTVVMCYIFRSQSFYGSSLSKYWV